MENSNKIILIAVLFLSLGTFFFSYRTSVKLDSLQKFEAPSFFDFPLASPDEAGGKTPCMTVSSSYRIDDRYVRSSVEKPEILGDKEGTVVVDFTVDWLGQVVKTRINSSSTITDENVLDAARKAVLKTSFNFAASDCGPQKGTVTYTYSLK